MPNPRQFLEEVVKPNLTEFANDYASIRLAHNAIAAVDALAAHLFWWCKDNAVISVATMNEDTDFRQMLATKDPDYALLHDIAKANKHVRLVHGSPELTDAGQVKSASLGWGEAAWGEGRFGGPPQVIVVTDTGQKRVVETLLNNALRLLENEMAASDC